MSIVATATTPQPGRTNTKTRIRFAPLPDPRRAVLITETGEELPLQAWLHHHTDSLYEKLSLVSSTGPLDTDICEEDRDEKDRQPSSIPASVSIAAFFTEESAGPGSSTSSVSESTLDAQHRQPHHHQQHQTTPPPSLPQSPTLPILSSPRSSSLSKKSRGSLFSRFKSGSLLNLSSADREDQGGNALRRWTSGSSTGSNAFEPISRTQSTQSYKGDNVRSRTLSTLNPFSSSTSNNNNSLSSSSSNSATGAASQKKRRRPSSAQGAGLIGTLHDQKPNPRMLNGRVYGAKRHSISGTPKNPFANAQDSGTEFVEWGYGGMGSVKNTNVGGSVWGKVQSEGSYGEDDGGGMEWVRKRKEQREKEKKEREEAEAAKKKAAEEAEAEKAASEASVEEPASAPTTPVPAHTPTTSASPIPSHMNEHRPTSPLAASSYNNSPEPQHHITRAVNIPAPPHHGHKHSSSQISVHTVTEKSSSAEAQKEVQQEEAQRAKEDDEEESSSSSSEDNGENEDEEEEEETEEEERMRNMQSIGAGVEKISRHNKT